MTGPVRIFRQLADDKLDDPGYDLDANPTFEELAAQQGKGPVHYVRILHGDF
jgi:hypothetical protein